MLRCRRYSSLHRRQDALRPAHGAGEAEDDSGGGLDVNTAKGGVLVNNFEVLKPDIMKDNGVIHVIGGLLTPEGADQTGTEQQR
jgi:uncharacterized surface protein with fasciclin (FAS1) repeats